MATRRPRVVVGCDGSQGSREALHWATDYAAATSGGLDLVSCWQWPTFQEVPITYGQWRPDASCGSMLRRLQSAIDLPEGCVTTEVIHGHPGQTLVSHSADADLLVVGSHGLAALSRLVLGSVSAFCVAHASCPVAVVRTDGATRKSGVLVGVDDSDNARSALRWAMDYADLWHQKLSVLCVLEPPAAPIAWDYPSPFSYPRTAVHRQTRQWLRDLVDKAQADRGTNVGDGIDLRVVTGYPAHVMVEESRHAGLTVCGRRGRGGFDRLLFGSVASALAHHGHGPLVVVPPG